MMTMGHVEEVERARRWLSQNCHCPDVRHALERALEYTEAVERAGIVSQNICGDDLYDFLCDPAAGDARLRAFPPPTL